MREAIIKATIDTLKSIKQPRFYKTERGYQGRFYCLLQSYLENAGVIDNDIILEMEYQKSARHQTSQRPDIILHIPIENRQGNVNTNNYAVWALKHHQRRHEASKDYKKIDEMFSRLGYPLGFFIVVDSDQHMLDSYMGEYQMNIYAFAVKLRDEQVVINKAHFENGLITVAQINA